MDRVRLLEETATMPACSLYEKLRFVKFGNFLKSVISVHLTSTTYAFVLINIQLKSLVKK